MLKITECSIPEIKYPVARMCKNDGLVVIFWKECKCTVVDKGESTYYLGYTTDDWSCLMYDAWKPVDIEISAGEIILCDNKSTRDEIVYPVVKQHRKNGMIVILTEPHAGVIADSGADEYYKIGDRHHLLDEESRWTSVNLRICG
ncbi:hypothetical protein [Snodgrassella alvi]|jgi:hypothetical protein|uniref:hypothetical protein n=1 Tax=Snodgrassella alvi TaxID=1196083 RepID=UPI000C1DD525|nr:hypothetical protein [Snodgrassella alvi]PIT48562.1 hypothetical protein BHC51_04785 [Snodgrassella alvi]